MEIFIVPFFFREPLGYKGVTRKNLVAACGLEPQTYGL
jgi:hypothetical protein